MCKRLLRPAGVVVFVTFYSLSPVAAKTHVAPNGRDTNPRLESRRSSTFHPSWQHRYQGRHHRHRVQRNRARVLSDCRGRCNRRELASTAIRRVRCNPLDSTDSTYPIWVNRQRNHPTGWQRIAGPAHPPRVNTLAEAHCGSTNFQLLHASGPVPSVVRDGRGGRCNPAIAGSSGRPRP
jgi:hypothetical protein